MEDSGSRTLALSTVTFDQPGYVLVYLTYESTSGYPVSLDDFTYTHTTTRVLASNAYYPFGMLSGQSWVRPENPLNRILYKAGNERNETTGYDETFYRLYDPALGRFMGVDPLAAVYGNKSPYHYANNNPLKYNDPMGDEYWYNNGEWEWCGCGGSPDGGSTYGRFRSQRTMYGPPSYGGMTIGSCGYWVDQINIDDAGLRFYNVLRGNINEVASGTNIYQNSTGGFYENNYGSYYSGFAYNKHHNS